MGTAILLEQKFVTTATSLTETDARVLVLKKLDFSAAGLHLFVCQHVMIICFKETKNVEIMT